MKKMREMENGDRFSHYGDDMRLIGKLPDRDVYICETADHRRSYHYFLGDDEFECLPEPPKIPLSNPRLYSKGVPDGRYLASWIDDYVIFNVGDVQYVADAPLMDSPSSIVVICSGGNIFMQETQTLPAQKEKMRLWHEEIVARRQPEEPERK